ncbi:MAG: nucleotidyltransferase family protein, partial [Candidatus Rokuibacteriota bacterium]
AGGLSSRMHSPKALLDFRGAPFAVRILEAFEALDLKTRVVVLGPDAPRIRPVLAAHDCVIIENPEPDSGPIGSLRLALAALRPVRPGAALVWPVDLPHVRLTTVERLIEAYRRAAPPTTPSAVVPVFAGRRGHPVIWDGSLFAELETSERATTEGPRAIMRAHRSEVLAVAVDDPAVVDDLNTPEDYERFVRQINRDAY